MCSPSSGMKHENIPVFPKIASRRGVDMTSRLPQDILPFSSRFRDVTAEDRTRTIRKSFHDRSLCAFPRLLI